jgi:hypothetical protein
MADQSSQNEIKDESTRKIADGEVAGDSEDQHAASPAMPPNTRIESVACGGVVSDEDNGGRQE